MVPQDRRREPRFPAMRSAEMVLLGEGDARVPVRVVEMSGQGLRMISPRQVKLDSAIRIDLDDCMLLGEVCHSASVPEGFSCGVRIEQVLTHVGDLTRLMTALMGHEPARTAK